MTTDDLAARRAARRVGPRPAPAVPAPGATPPEGRAGVVPAFVEVDEVGTLKPLRSCSGDDLLRAAAVLRARARRIMVDEVLPLGADADLLEQVARGEVGVVFDDPIEPGDAAACGQIADTDAPTTP